jgi:acetyl-CoA acetyltransferase
MRKGDIGPFMDSNDTTYKGNHPTNTNGGQLSMGQLNPGGASGCQQILETVRQLSGRAATDGEGGHQVEGAKLGIWNT